METGRRDLGVVRDKVETGCKELGVVGDGMEGRG